MVRGVQTGIVGPPEPGPHSPDAQKHEHVWVDGACALCGEKCGHVWHDGFCTVCGAPCPGHIWRGGVCTRCGYVCPHLDHDPETLVCADCGEKTIHRYVDLVCSCGAEPQFITDPVEFPEDVLDGSERKGTLETFVYDSRDGSVHGGKREYKTEREFVVYTPYGYDPGQKYNVLVLLHGAGQNCHEWLERRHIFSAAYPFFFGSDLLDAMIERGDCEPLIVVSAEYRFFGSPAEISGPFSRELREGVLPYVVANYSTWASLDEDGKLIPAREHFAFAAASFGSMIMWGGMIEDCADVFAYWGGFSGNVTTTDGMVAEINAAAEAGYVPQMLYAGGGAQEESSYSDQRRFAETVERCECLGEGNTAYHFIKDREHAYATWDMCLYNCLLVFFRNSHEAPEATP